MHTKNIDQIVPQQPKMALNFVRLTIEDSDSEELEVEPMHSCSPMSELGFEVKSNSIVVGEDNTETDSAERKTRGSDCGKSTPHGVDL